MGKFVLELRVVEVVLDVLQRTFEIPLILYACQTAGVFNDPVVLPNGMSDVKVKNPDLVHRQTLAVFEALEDSQSVRVV